MDPSLLRLYNDELTHLREVGAEFAQEFPKIAARLSMDGLEVADPYVERLLEGFAFLAARMQLKIEAEHPRLVQHLLETVYPGFLSPVPSMMIARLQPDLLDPNLARGFTCRAAAPLISDTAARPEHPLRVPHRARGAAVADRDRSRCSTSATRPTCR